MESSPESRIENLQNLGLQILGYEVMNVLFGKEFECNRSRNLLKNCYIALNEETEKWDLVEKTNIDRTKYSHMTNIEGIVCGDNQIFLVVRSELDLDIQANRVLGYLQNWPTDTPPRKYQQAIRL